MSTNGDRPELGDAAPVLSVIVPTFRREDMLVRAVRSILDDDLPPFEVLVIDDSPEGSARSVIESLGDARVRYLHHDPPSGGKPALVRNFGISLARGEFLYFLDDDDQAAPGGLRSLIDAIRAEPGKAVAFGTVTCIGPNETVRDNYNEWFAWAAKTAAAVSRSKLLTVGTIMFRGTLIINSCCLIRATAARELGGYDHSIPVYEDVEFFTRAIRKHGHVFVEQPVLIYSTGQQSIIHDLKGDGTKVRESYERMHAKYRSSYGTINYRVLQVLGKYLPFEHPPIR